VRRSRSTALAVAAGILAPPILLLFLWSLRSFGGASESTAMPPIVLDLGPRPGSAAGPGVLRGTVLDTNGASIAGAEVRAEARIDGDTFLGAARSDAEGRFAIEGAPRAPLAVTALAGRHEPARVVGVTPGVTAIELVLAPRPAIPALPVPVPPPSAGTLGGRCTRTDGGPLGAFRVLAVPLDEEGNETAAVTSAAVDPRGFFEMTSLPPGPVHLVVLPARREHDPRLRLATAIAEVVPGDAKLVDLSFAAAGIAGVVRDPEGRPLVGAVVRFSVRRGAGDPIDAGIARTGEDGAFRVADLPECTLEIEAHASGLETASAAVETSLGMTREVVLRLK